jgi:hypothetical protein
LPAGWEVVGVSRRKPELPSGRKIDFPSVDLRDEEKARAAFEPPTDVTHIAYAALHEKPELVAGRPSKEQIDTNNTTRCCSWLPTRAATLLAPIFSSMAA